MANIHIELTTALAIYASVIATTSLLWNVIIYLKDRGRLNVKAGYAIELTVLDDGHEVRPKINTILITNSGRRACVVYEVGVFKIGLLGSLRLTRLFASIGFRRNHYDQIIFNELPSRIDFEDMIELKFHWDKLYFIPYGTKISFYAKNSLGVTAFSKPRKIDDYKDPDFEDPSVFSCDLDQELIEKLRPPAHLMSRR